MINYELAKQLKDAGFPMQEHRLNEYAACERCNGKLDKECDPTLSELIEACDDGWLTLTREGKNGSRWVADIGRGPEKEPIVTFGSTASEAVANLWLELNKK